MSTIEISESQYDQINDLYKDSKDDKEIKSLIDTYFSDEYITIPEYYDILRNMK